MELPHDQLKTAVINSDIVAIVDSEGVTPLVLFFKINF